MICRTHGTLCLAVFLATCVCGCSDSGDEPTGQRVTRQFVAAKSADGRQGNADDKADVEAAWAEFKEASLSGKGEIAAGRVTSATHDYYEEIRKLALEGSRDELGKYVFMKRYIALSIRLRIPADRLRSMSGRELFVYSVDQGWIAKNSATDEGIREVTVTGDHARAVATKAGQPIGLYYHFVKEDGVWRLDMLQLMKFANAAFDRMLQHSGMTEAQFTKRFLEATTGKTVTDDLWIPPDAEHPDQREPE